MRRASALVGVAASTSFQQSRTATIPAPGQSASQLDGYTIRQVRPTATATPEKISLVRSWCVTSGRQQIATLHTSYGLYPSQDPTRPIGLSLRRVQRDPGGLKSGPPEDIWTAINPNVSALQGLINQGDARFTKFLDDAMAMPAAQRTRALSELYSLRDLAIRGLAQRFVDHPWAPTFLIIVSPLVTWLWAGALIAAFGGLPRRGRCPHRGRRRVTPPSPRDEPRARPRQLPRCAPGSWSLMILSYVIVAHRPWPVPYSSSPRPCEAHAARSSQRSRPRASPNSRRPATPSTSRFVTPSSTYAPGSSQMRTMRPSTRRFGPSGRDHARPGRRRSGRRGDPGWG